MYYTIQPDIYSNFGILDEPEFSEPSTSFLRGSIINDPIELPMRFTSNFTQEESPGSFIGSSIPLWSRELREFFANAGIDNVQYFDAILRNDELGLEWSDHKAVNIIGLVACADLTKSVYIEITKSPSGVPFAHFSDLVIDSSKTGDLSIFRLAENPSKLLIHERIFELVMNNRPANGWGISIIPVEES